MVSSSISTMLEQVQTLKELYQAIHDPETKEGSLEACEPGVSSLRLGDPSVAQSLSCPSETLHSRQRLAQPSPQGHLHT